MGGLARKLYLADSGFAAGTQSAAAAEPTGDPVVAGILEGLECVGRGAAVLDGDGRLVGANARAHDLFERFATIRDGRLQFHGANHTERVDHAVRQAQDGHHAVVALAVPPADTVVVRAIQLSPGTHSVRRADVLLVLSRGAGEPMPSLGCVREAFGLTATEAEIALALAGGASASMIARDRGICRETVRSHLKTIYAKTGTGRQAGLVAAVMHLRDVVPPA